MKSLLFSLCIPALCFLPNNSSVAMNPYSGKTIAQTQHTAKSTNANGCTIPVDQFDLDINNVRAMLLDAGDMWWDLSTAQYEVPKGPAGSGAYPQAIFAGAIWISALDQGNNLHIAAQTYRQGTSDFWAGPLDNNGSVTSSTCSQWDQHFAVFSSEITPLISAYQNSGAVPAPLLTANLKNWPGKGNPYLTALSYDMSGVLAPFYDANGDGIYNPADGDYPTLRQGGTPASQTRGCDSLIYNSCAPYANQMVFWVMNDEGNTHTATNGVALGIQINALAFAYQSLDSVLNDMTMYTYNFINKSGGVLNKTYISQFTDVDLGCSNNDRVGCDTTRNMAIQYNGFLTANTPGYNYTCDLGTPCVAGIVGYGSALPMIGIKFLEGPRDTVINQVTHQPAELGMSCFASFNINGSPTTGDPTTAAQFRNYQTGIWQDGTPITYGGDGYMGSQATPYMYPGDPSLSNQWSECNPQTGPAILSGDRRFVQTCGPFTFMPCAQEFLSLAVIFVQPPGGVGSNCPSWALMDSAADKVQRLFDQCFQPLGLTGIRSIAADMISVYPNPVSSLLYFAATGQRPVDAVSLYDLTGRLVLSRSGSIHSIDMAGLPDGIYFVRASSAGRQSSFKVVKE